MPLPTTEAQETLRTRLRTAIDNNLREVFGTEDDGTPLIGHDGRETLINLYESPALASEFESWLRGHARQAGWDEVRLRSLNFRPYRQEYERRVEEERRRTAQARNVVRGLRVVQGGRSRPSAPSGEETGDMPPAQMVESDSLFLIAVGTLMLRRRGRVWFDNFHKRYITNWTGKSDDEVVANRTRSDSFDLNVYAWLQQIDPRLAKMSDRMCANALSHFADQDQRNEVADWMNSLTWDGVDRLTATLPEAFKTEDDDYHRAVGRCWFVSMAARVLEPGCKVDTMPVFMGGQGKQKSFALEIIGGKWHRAASSGVDSKDFLMELHGALVFEIPELHSITKTTVGTDKVKAVLSTRIDHFRAPYGRHIGEHKRTAVFAGNTNKRGWHLDETGGRRFWPVFCPALIDLEWLRRNRDQLFAEACTLYKAGASWWDVPEEEQARRIEAERHIDPWEEILVQRLSSPDLYDGWNNVVPKRGDGGTTDTSDYGSIITTQRICIVWLRLTPEQTSRWSRKLSDIMRSLGWETTQRRVNDWPNPIRFWIRRADTVPRDEEGAVTGAVTAEPVPFAGRDEEPPF